MAFKQQKMYEYNYSIHEKQVMQKHAHLSTFYPSILRQKKEE